MSNKKDKKQTKTEIPPPFDRNMLTPEEKEYLEQKTRDATEFYKTVFPNMKTRKDKEKEKKKK